MGDTGMQCVITAKGLVPFYSMFFRVGRLPGRVQGDQCEKKEAKIKWSVHRKDIGGGLPGTNAV